MTRRHTVLLAGCLVAAGVVGLGTTEAQADQDDRAGSIQLMPEVVPRGFPPVPIPEARLTGPRPVPLPLVEPFDQRAERLAPLSELELRQ